MNQMTDAELAILSLLAEGEAYDKELSSEIDARGLRRWTAIGTSSMYYVLEKLERQGLIEKHSRDGKNDLYQITAAGIGVLQTAVSDLLSTPYSHNKNLELGLANLHVLKPSQIRAALLARQQDTEAQLSRVREERKHSKDIFQIEALFDHYLTMMQAELDWLNRFIAEWEAQAPAEPAISSVDTQEIPRIKQVILPQDPDSVHKETTREVPPQNRKTVIGSDTPPPKKKKD